MNQPPKKHAMRKTRGPTNQIDPATVVARYQKGDTISEMMREHKTTYHRIFGILQAAGGPIRRGRPTCAMDLGHLKDKALAIAARYQQGWTGNRLCEHYKTTWKMIRAVLVQEGVKIHGRGTPKGTIRKLGLAKRSALIARINECRGTQLQIAEHYGISREMVRQYAKQIGCTWYTQQEKTNRSVPLQQESKAKQEAARQHKRTLRAEAKAIAADMWAQGCTLEDIGSVMDMEQKVMGARISSWRTESPELFPYRRAPKLATEAQQKVG